jgi:hypothetical protein
MASRKHTDQKNGPPQQGHELVEKGAKREKLQDYRHNRDGNKGNEQEHNRTDGKQQALQCKPDEPTLFLLVVNNIERLEYVASFTLGTSLPETCCAGDMLAAFSPAAKLDRRFR